MEKIEEEINLGYILKLIRVEIFKLSLLDFGHLVGFSASAYQRYEKNNFGKNFYRNDYIKLKNFSECIANVVFKSDLFQKKLSKIEIALNLKITLNKIYNRLDNKDAYKEQILKEFNVATEENLSNYIHLFFMSFLEYKNTANQYTNFEHLVLPYHMKLQKTDIKTNQIGESELSIYENEDVTYKKLNTFDYTDNSSREHYIYQTIEIQNATNLPLEFFIYKERVNELNLGEIRIAAIDKNFKRLSIEYLVCYKPCITQIFKIFLNQHIKPLESTLIFLNFWH